MINNISVIVTKNCVEESIKITSFCVLITIILALLNFPEKTILLILTIIVISERAAFSPDYKNTKNSCLSLAVMLCSNVSGGIISFYYPMLAKILIIFYATLAFYVPDTRSKLNIFMLGAILFIVSPASPFNLADGSKILILGSVIAVLFQIYIMLLQRHKADASLQQEECLQNNSFMAITVFASLIIAFIFGNYLQHIHRTFYTYWMMLTIVSVIQDSKYQTIIISLKRILVNILGALLVIVLYNYLLPDIFWINLIVLYILLFCIFIFWSSYVGRVFFLEMFVFGCMHVIGVFHTSVAVDRILFTVIGGLIVIIFLTMISFVVKIRKKISN